MPTHRLIVLVLTAALASCAAQEPDESSSEQSLAHVADLATAMPSHLVIVDTMAWFGIPSSNPGGGPDGAWGNWDIPTFSCVPDRAPATCDASGHREVASRYHPLAGIYSSSGKDAEGLARMKLMLSNLRSGCDSTARIDAFAVQLNGTHFSSLHGGTSGGAVEIALSALKGLLAEADAEHRTGAVLPMDDATWYWNNGHYVGLDCAANRATCIADLQQDVIDMLKVASPHASALRIAGKLVLHFYIDTAAGFPTATEWQTMFANARAAVGADFYTIATHAPASYFSAFDAIAPWVDPGYAWPHTSGATIYDHARAYAAQQHDALFAAVPAGHVVFGNVSPGFDDFTEQWGACKQRQLPPAAEGTPRSLDVIRGSVDYLATKHVKGVLVTTWDDWTEGSFIEPSVEEGTTKLVTLRQKLGDLFGEPQDAIGDSRLSARWTSYGVTYACGAASAFNAPAMCPTACGAAAVVTPTVNEPVGPSIHLRVTIPPCIGGVIAYIDGHEVARATDAPIELWVPVTMGHHVLHVNAWEGTGALHQTADVPFDRTY